MQSDTIIYFIFFDKYLPDLRVQLWKAKIIHFFYERNIIKIPGEIFKNEKYIEVFDVFEEYSDNSKYTFQMEIYRGITNYIYYDKTQNRLSTVELFFYGKKNLPTSIKYKGYDLNDFNTNENEYRKAMCFANINPYDLDCLNNETFKNKGYKFTENSYQIFIMFAENNTIQYSLSIMKNASFLSNETNNNEIEINKEDITDLNAFYSNYSSFLDNLSLGLNEESKQYLSVDLDELNTEYDNIKKKKIFNYLLDPLNYKIIQDALKPVYYSYFLFQYKYIYDKGNTLSNFYCYLVNAKETNTAINNFFNLLDKDINLIPEEKVKMLKAVSEICNKSLFGKKSVTGIKYVNIEKINIDNPYQKAVELITNIVDHLNENSRLFETFLYFNSGTIENRLEKNKQIKYEITNSFDEIINYTLGEYKTEFGLSLLNVEQVKDHLKKLIPKYIIRIETLTPFRAYFDKETNIMFINEEIMFNQKIMAMDLLFKEKDSDKYVVPIVIEIFHEMMSHGKVRLIEKGKKSPRCFRDSKNNFEYNSIFKMCKIEGGSFEKMPIPESGKIFEHFISGDKSVILALKTPSIENVKFLNYKYWIGSDFEFIVKEIEQRNLNNNISLNNMLLDEIDDDYVDDCYIKRETNCVI